MGTYSNAQETFQVPLRALREASSEADDSPLRHPRMDATSAGTALAEPPRTTNVAVRDDVERRRPAAPGDERSWAFLTEQREPMEPLDLRRHPPRGPRETILDCVFLPRTIDKIRGELPGGNLGDYVVTGRNSISAYVLHKLKIDVDALREVVARAQEEREVETWLRERVDPQTVAEINLKLTASRVDALDRDTLESVYSLHPLMRNRDDVVTTFELLEADDAATFARG